MMNVSVTLDAKDIASHFRCDGQTTIHDYLYQMILEYEADGDQCLFLPSLVSLSECFQSSAVEVHQALSRLKEYGYDFFIMGFEAPITFWCPLKIQQPAAVKRA